MIEIVKTEYVLTCDCCDSKSEPGEIESFVGQGWHFDTWNSGNEYKFHALTCSLECRYNKLRNFARHGNFTHEIELIDAIRSIAGSVKYPESRPVPVHIAHIALVENLTKK